VSARELLIFGCLVRRRQVRGFCSFENQTFTFVNNCFQNKSNEEIGDFWQALINYEALLYMKLRMERYLFL
jgi:hypothetical protein